MSDERVVFCIKSKNQCMLAQAKLMTRNKLVEVTRRVHAGAHVMSTRQ